MFPKRNSSFFSNDAKKIKNCDLSSYSEKVEWKSITQIGNSVPALAAKSVHSEFDVAVLLGYYNGNEFLSEQIHSILSQTYSNLEIFVLDDNSGSPVDINALNIAATELQRIHFAIRSRNVGFSQNFLNGLYNLDSTFKYYAFSDQDDIWFPSKIQDAINFLESVPSDKPALYCARTTSTDKEGRADLGLSPLFSKSPSFANAMVQSIAGGNTMVMNRSARELIINASANCSVVSHDWWCYQIVSGAGGIVHYDKNSCLKYRQHAGNIVGSNNGWSSRIIRLLGVLKGKFRDFNDINLKALSINRQHLTQENESKLDNFIRARQNGFIKRIILFKRAGIYRQTLLGNLGLIFGIFINRV